MSNQRPSDLIAPVAQSERILILDSLRGIAILGILLMNIPGFGLPQPGYGDPFLMGEYGTINFKVWYYIDWFMEGTQRALFSMLFGAGTLIFIGRISKRTSGLQPADFYFRRQLWLLLLGVFNGFVLLWFWDILFQYAVCGMLLFVFRNMSAKGLLVAAFLSLIFMTTRENVDLYRDKQVIAKGEMVAKIDTLQQKLTPEQQEQFEAYTGMQEKSKIESRTKANEASLRKMRGDYATLYKYQSERSFEGEVFYTYFGLWDVLLCMFIGMAFFKMGILTNQSGDWVYGWLFIIGMGVGLWLSYYRLQPSIQYMFNGFDIKKNISFEFYEISRIFRSLGLFGLIMLLYRSGLFNWVFKILQPVGQMALTNYLTQSLFVGLYFYGIGFGNFGHLQRYEIYYVVGITWLIQIIWSNIWLRYFRFGPVEWAWRSLTYWKLQPLVRKA